MRPRGPRHRRWTLRKFLYFIVICVMLVAAGLFALRMFADELTEAALVPDTEFVEQDALDMNAYQDPDMWFSRPGKGVQDDPARWQPAVSEDRSLLPSPADPTATPKANPAAPTATASASPNPTPSPNITPFAERSLAAHESGETEETAPAETAPEPADTPRFAVFFVHPTSYFDKSTWNAALDDDESQRRARLMVRGLASAFNQADEIWVPRYRQATFGAFLTDVPEAQQALDAAYADIAQAFDFFLESIGPDMPFVLAGHSQGGYHITRLLQEKVTGTELQARVAMVYPVGWPISIEHDLPALGLPACSTPQQSACIMTWASFAEPADPGLFFKRYAATPGLSGELRGESPILCVNPLTGTINDEADMARNLGTLVPNENFTSGELVAGAIPARCGPRGLLLIGDPPEMGNQRFPGNNYHLVDIPLFWKNLQRDVVTRVGAWGAAQGMPEPSPQS